MPYTRFCFISAKICSFLAAHCMLYMARGLYLFPACAILTSENRITKDNLCSSCAALCRLRAAGQEAKMEAGENPARSRHCEGASRRKTKTPSQETCTDGKLLPRRRNAGSADLDAEKTDCSEEAGKADALQLLSFWRSGEGKPGCRRMKKKKKN